MKELILAFLDDDGNLTRTETVKNSTGALHSIREKPLLPIPSRGEVLTIYNPGPDGEEAPWPYVRWVVHLVERSAFIGGTGKEEAVLGRNMSSSCILWLKPFTGALPKRPLRPQGA